MCFTTVAVVASVMTEENRAEVLPRFYGLSKMEALEVAAALKPRKVVPARTVVTRVDTAVFPETPAQQMQPGWRRLDEQVVSRTDAQQEVHPGELWVPRTVVDPLTATESRLHITVSRELLALLKKAKAGESHLNPGATDEQVLKLALEALIEKQAKRKACVPAKVKREVLKRDQERCQWKLADGGTCGATGKLEVDHVVPAGKGRARRRWRTAGSSADRTISRRRGRPTATR